MSTYTISNPTAPASPAQIAFYASLSADFATRMDPKADVIEVKALATAWANGSTKGKVSDAISNLKANLAKMPKPEIKPIAPGYYTLGDDVYTVVTSKTSGKTYAKKWSVAPGATKATWVYAPGVMGMLSGATPMTLDDAKAFGHTHGYCIRCGRLLTDPVSVENGIGPICAGYWS